MYTNTSYFLTERFLCNIYMSPMLPSVYYFIVYSKDLVLYSRHGIVLINVTLYCIYYSILEL